MKTITILIKFEVVELSDRPTEEILQGFEEPVNYMQLAVARSYPVAWMEEKEGVMIDYEIVPDQTDRLFRQWGPILLQRLFNFFGRHGL